MWGSYWEVRETLRSILEEYETEGNSDGYAYTEEQAIAYLEAILELPGESEE